MALEKRKTRIPQEHKRDNKRSKMKKERENVVRLDDTEFTMWIMIIYRPRITYLYRDKYLLHFFYPCDVCYCFDRVISVFFL